MPTYPVIHKETKETQELYMSMAEYDQWRKDNPDWDKDWSQGCAGVGEVGDWKDTKVPGSFKDVLGRIKKSYPNSTFEV